MRSSTNARLLSVTRSKTNCTRRANCSARRCSRCRIANRCSAITICCSRSRVAWLANGRCKICAKQTTPTTTVAATKTRIPQRQQQTQRPLLTIRMNQIEKTLIVRNVSKHHEKVEFDFFLDFSRNGLFFVIE